MNASLYRVLDHIKGVHVPVYLSGVNILLLDGYFKYCKLCPFRVFLPKYSVNLFTFNNVVEQNKTEIYSYLNHCLVTWLLLGAADHCSGEGWKNIRSSPPLPVHVHSDKFTRHFSNNNHHNYQQLQQCRISTVM